MKESTLLRKILTEYPASGHRLWRMHSMSVWAGKSKRITEPTTLTLQRGDVVITRANRVKVGFDGLSDLMGFTKVTITKDMVGREVAVLTACETKSSAGKATKAQQNFIRMVNQNGGIAVIARRLTDLFEAVNKFMEGNHESRH